MYQDHSSDIIVTIVESVADHIGVDLLDMPPLGNHIDCDALTALFEGTADDPSTGVDRITFTYCKHEITVRPGEPIDISPVRR